MAMASKASREGESPSASFTLLPQVRTRRGSLASLASTTQLDKEAIAQALDQIHISASQSDSLTTFNEYTSPPSSSHGPDNKGIAGDLQGGISGLYSRLRASVGNVKDAVGSGLDDLSSDRPVAANPRASAPVSNVSLKGGEEPTRNIDIGRPHDDPNKQRPDVRQLADEGRLSLDRAPTLKPPPTPLKQPSKSTAQSPSLAAIHSRDVDGSTDSQLSETATTDLTQGTLEKSRKFGDGKEALLNTESKGDQVPQQGEHSVPKALPVLHVNAISKQADGHASVTAGRGTRSPRLDDVFGSVSGGTGSFPPSGSHMGSKYQHLEIPIRKSLAPPVVNRSASPRPSLSRASSTETNADSLISVPQHSSSPPTLAKLDLGNRKSGTRSNMQMYSKPAVLRDPRTMNVFSQVKNKVLNKEYWMKDENARDCFFCGDAFSTFRRKHHCSK